MLCTVYECLPMSSKSRQKSHTMYEATGLPVVACGACVGRTKEKELDTKTHG